MGISELDWTECDKRHGNGLVDEVNDNDSENKLENARKCKIKTHAKTSLSLCEYHNYLSSMCFVCVSVQFWRVIFDQGETVPSKIEFKGQNQMYKNAQYLKANLK